MSEVRKISRGKSNYRVKATKEKSLWDGKKQLVLLMLFNGNRLMVKENRVKYAEKNGKEFIYFYDYFTFFLTAHVTASNCTFDP